MFKGFNLRLDRSILDSASGAGLENLPYLQYLKEQKERVRKIITEKTIQCNVIDGTQLQNDWFPQINAEVFISHSHQDLNLAISFAAWLKRYFNIDSFIDSNVWGYADDLLKAIDDEFCCDKVRNVYNYNKRNYSTAHIHSMLSNALIQMIDKTECLFFLNTPHSLSISDTVQNKTQSPWLYLELSASQFIRKTPPLPNRGWTKTAGYIQNSRFSIQYDVDMSHLTAITVDALSNWKKTYDTNEDEHPLDLLYQICQ